MPSSPYSNHKIGRAERSFRDAFTRLKLNETRILPKGSHVTQNNVAREAGCDPSALRKSRFPNLVEEIQYWVAENSKEVPPSKLHTSRVQRTRNRDLRDRIKALELQRDKALGLLAEADALILALTNENSRLRALTPSNVTHIGCGR